LVSRGVGRAGATTCALLRRAVNLTVVAILQKRLTCCELLSAFIGITAQAKEGARKLGTRTKLVPSYSTCKRLSLDERHPFRFIEMKQCHVQMI
jgi:hypothetical protein